MQKNNILLIMSLLFAFLGNAEVSKTVNVTIPGTLRTLLTSSEMTTVTDLTVTGSIDARDFKFMRDGVTNLAILDISDVAVLSYDGTGGTLSTAVTSYPVNELPAESFYAKRTLTALSIPNSVTSIGDKAFYYCTGLTSLIIPNSVMSIGDYAFSYCAGLTSLTIPNSVTLIGHYAFYICGGLTSLTIGNSVRSIGDYAFSYCGRLTSLTIPNSVTSIGDSAFYNCGGLTNLIIGNSVRSIGNYAFCNCSRLKSLTIPNSVMLIGDSAFSYCAGFTSLIIGDSVTSIGNYAFSYCAGLKSLTIPNSVTSIGDYVFFNCIGLTSLTIGNSVMSIGNRAFSGCTGLTSIYSYATTPVVLSSDVFASVNVYACDLYVPAGSKSAYQAALIWGDFNIVELAPSALHTLASESINFYPNPFTDGFYVNGLEGTGFLTLTDLSGKVMLAKQVKTNDCLSFDSLPQGVYIVKITTASGTIERKVIKK